MSEENENNNGNGNDQNPTFEPGNKYMTGNDPLGEINRAIDYHRSIKGTILDDRWATRLTDLYQTKADLMVKNTPRSELPAHLQETLEKNGVQEKKSPQLTDQRPSSILTTEVDKEVDQYLRNTHGQAFDELHYETVANAKNIFGTAEAAQQFISKHLQDSESQIEAFNVLQQVTSEVPSPNWDMPIEEVHRQVEAGLGFDTKSELFTDAQKAMNAIFGSGEKFDRWATRNGFTRDAKAQIRLVRGLARIGSRLK